MELELDKFLKSLSISNSIVMGREIEVKSVSSPSDSPAWCSSDTVYINQRLFSGELSSYDIITIKGANLHELAHMMFSPRNGSSLVKRINELGLWKSYIALEDQRIERLILKIHKSAWKWLSGVFIIHVSNKSISKKEIFPLIAGRKYLTNNFRDYYRNLYSKSADKAEKLVEDFIIEASNVKLDIDKIVNIVSDFSEFFISDTPLDPFSHQDREFDGVESSINRPLEQSSLDLTNFYLNLGTNESENLEKNLEIEISLIKKSLSNSDSSSITSNKKDNIQKLNYESNLSIMNSKVAVAPSELDIKNLKFFKKELSKKIKHPDPSWESMHVHGKLDVIKFLNRKNNFNFFKKFINPPRPLKNLYLIVDSSFSMNGVKASSNYKFSWLINNSLKKENFNIKTVFFNDDSIEIDYRDESIIPMVSNSGGSNLKSAIELIKNELFSMHASYTNYLIILSDNSFALDFSYDIRQLENLRVKVFVLEITSNGRIADDNKLNSYAKISGEPDLLDVITKIVD